VELTWYKLCYWLLLLKQWVNGRWNGLQLGLTRIIFSFAVLSVCKTFLMTVSTSSSLFLPAFVFSSVFLSMVLRRMEGRELEILLLTWPVLRCQLNVLLCRSFLLRSCPKADFRTTLNSSSGLRSFLTPTTTCMTMMPWMHVEENHLAQSRLQYPELLHQNDQSWRPLRRPCLLHDSRWLAHHDLVRAMSLLVVVVPSCLPLCHGRVLHVSGSGNVPRDSRGISRRIGIKI